MTRRRMREAKDTDKEVEEEEKAWDSVLRNMFIVGNGRIIQHERHWRRVA